MSREKLGKYVLRTENLTKIYGSHRAVNAVDIHVKKGDVYGNPVSTPVNFQILRRRHSRIQSRLFYQGIADQRI